MPTISQQLWGTQALYDIGANMESTFIKPGLTGEQEKLLIDNISEAEKNTERLFEKKCRAR